MSPASKKVESGKKPPEFINKKARRNYEILETAEAGIVLVGTEVKSLRNGRAEIGDAHVLPRGGELFLLNLRIEPYQNASYFNHEETRTRKLLLKRKEIEKFSVKVREKSLTLIPLKMYFNARGKVKVLLGLGRGKKSHDRREDEKKAQAKKEIAQAVKNYNRRSS